MQDLRFLFRAEVDKSNLRPLLLDNARPAQLVQTVRVHLAAQSRNLSHGLGGTSGGVDTVSKPLRLNFGLCGTSGGVGNVSVGSAPRSR